MRPTRLLSALAAILMMGAIFLAPALSTAQAPSGSSDWAATSVTQMSPNQEPNLTTPIPANSNETGVLVLQMDNSSNQICYSLWVSGVSNITQAHIHLGPVGQEGPVVAWLFPSEKANQSTASLNSTKMPGSFTGLLAKGNITASDLIGPMQGKTLKDFMAAIWAGQTYVNVHTTQNPGGEIRNQITPDDFWENALAVPLTTREEPIPVNLTSGGTMTPTNTSMMANLTGVNLKDEPWGLARFQLNNTTSMVHFEVWAFNLHNVTLVHIDQGARGVRGQAIAPMWPMANASGGAGGSTMIPMVNGMLAEGNITVAQLTGILQGKGFTDLVNDLMSGSTYVNVHTTQNPSGEMRGQIDPANLTCPNTSSMMGSSGSIPMSNPMPSGNQPMSPRY